MPEIHPIAEERNGYSYHVEPEKVGGQRYVKCNDCGRELLVELGGIDQLVHADGCSNE